MDERNSLTKIEQGEGTEDSNLTYTTLEEYTYDSLDQLKQVDYLTQNKRVAYTYDLGGNITKEKIYTLADDGTATLSESNAYVYGDINWKDKLTAYKGQTITYDAIGNPLTYRDGFTFTWSNGRQLDSYTKDGKTVSYTYDTNGMRLSKTVDGVEYTYLYKDGLLVQETRGTDIFDYSYDANGSIRMLTCSSTIAEEDEDPMTYYYALNSRGDVIGLYNGLGNLIAKYTYDVWGNEVSITNGSGDEISNYINIATIQPFRYRSYYYDTDSGLYYLQSRYYDPVTHRFINADGYVSTGTGVIGHNMFAYCNNNPINHSDPSGERIYPAGFIGPIQQGDYRIGDSWTRPASRTSSNPSAPAYQELKGGSSSISPNCYSYAIGMYDRGYNPGAFSNMSFNMTLDSVAYAFICDMYSLGRGVREINGYDAFVYEGEYRIALRVKQTPGEKGVGFLKTVDWDYHFMVETDTGRWAEKPSSRGNSILHPIGQTPETINWNCGSYHNYYDSDILYFAITN